MSLVSTACIPASEGWHFAKSNQVGRGEVPFGSPRMFLTLLDGTGPIALAISAFTALTLGRSNSLAYTIYDWKVIEEAATVLQ